MNVELLGFVSFGIFLFLYFTTPKIYRSKWFFPIALSSLAVCFTFFLFICYKYDKPRQALLVFLTFYYFLLLLIIKYVYKKWNNFFIRKKWIADSYLNKDFIFAHYSDDGEAVVWEEKIDRRPSWLDYLFSYSLLFGPMLLTYWTPEAFGSLLH
jgi:hypothetical protein